MSQFEPNGEAAKRIAAVTPYFPFKGIPRFYDIGGFMRDPEIFQLVVDAFAHRYKDVAFDMIGGIDARGFVLGPPLALALKKPFFMIRKKGKMPNAIAGEEYSKEYEGKDILAVPRGLIQPNTRVLLVDDLVATGGTLIAAIDLIKKLGGVVAECACVVELKAQNGRANLDGRNHKDVPIWGLLDESLLTLNGLADPDVAAVYEDDGEPH